MSKIQIKRGDEVNLPILDIGEPALTTDKGGFYVGSASGNIEYAKKAYVDEQVQLATASGISKLVSYDYSLVATEENQMTFEIPYEYFDKTTDTLAVFFDGIKRPTTDYTVTNPVGITRGFITLLEVRPLDSHVGIMILKNILAGDEGAVSGTVIAVGTMPIDRVVGLQTQLDNIDTSIGNTVSYSTSTGNEPTEVITEYNFIDHIGALETEVQTARGGSASLDERLDANDVSVAAKANQTALNTTNTNLDQLVNPNLLINSDFKIWQRGTPIGDIYNLYGPDRWYCSKTGGNQSFTKVANGCQVSITGGNTYLHQFVEGISRYKDKTFTLSVSINDVVYKVTGVASAGPTFPTSFGTMQVSYDSGKDVITVLVRIDNATVVFNWAKLELGTKATPFSPIPYAEELAMCQRYFEKSYDANTAPGTNIAAGLITQLLPSNTVINGQSYGTVYYGVQKRVSPNIIIYSRTGTQGQISNYSLVDAGVNSATVHSAANSKGFGLWNSNGSSFTTSYNTIYYHYTADAEIY